MVSHPRLTSGLVVCLLTGVVVPAFAQPGHEPGLSRPAHSPQQVSTQGSAASLTQVVVNGARFFADADILHILDLRVGARLPSPPDDLARKLQARYRTSGYAFAVVTARFDEGDGRLTIDVDEGRIDAVEFEGVPVGLAAQLSQDFALQPGDVFRENEATRALRTLLQPTQGAVRAVTELASADAIGVAAPFEMVQRDGKHVLVVHLVTRRSDFKISAGTGGREDWFDPVDGLAPAIGFNETVFDRDRFNHTYITGYASYKFGPERAGYAIGFERPFLAGQRLFVGAEAHDETMSDDFWRLTRMEQSLAGAGFKATFRDYYRRRGYQLNVAVRPTSHQEILAAWRDEREEPLVNASDFSLFRGEQIYRANQQAEPGRLHALLFGYTWDSRGLAEQARAAQYERHQMVDAFGTSGGRRPGWRVEWTSEVAAPGTLGGTFEYRRHILNVRRYNRFSPNNALYLRGIVGIGEGTLPPQRLFGLGGVGTVPGYQFKEAQGTRMLLFNAEYAFGRVVRPLVLYDAGRVFRPVGLSRDAWMHAVGGGIEFGRSLRVEAMWPLEHGRSAELLVRLAPTF